MLHNVIGGQLAQQQNAAVLLQVFNHAGYNDAGQAAWLMF